MLSSRDIKRKIKSIGNTWQITRAMEMVAATKMHKSQIIALRSRPYCEKALELLGNLSRKTSIERTSLTEKREVKKIALVVVSSDKGLCGGLNANVFKKSLEFLKNQSGREVDIIAVGKKSKDFFSYKKYNVVENFIGMGDMISLKDTTPIGNTLINLYKNKDYDLIMTVYTNFLSILKQEAVVRQILPIDIEEVKKVVKGIVPETGKYSDLKENEKEVENNKNYKYKLEPRSREILEDLMANFLQIQVYHMVLESNASEHSARMVAMKNASESAKKLIDGFTLQYNKVRQTAITNEISEIVAGSEI